VRRIHYRFGAVLGLILVTLAYTLAAPEGDGARLVAVTLQAGTLVAAVVASRAHRWVIRLSVVVAVLGVAGATAALLGTDEFGQGSAVIVALPYVALTPPAIAWGLVKHFREEGGVTVQTIFGVLCLYLLVGLLFGVGFAVVEELSNRDFFTAGAARSDDFLYYSFSTLTTVGYGDLVAATDLGRSLSITEALVGQIYLVTVVAVIVGNLRPTASRPQA
jgi:hypothetical protein